MKPRPPTPPELDQIARTRQAYRAMWTKLRNVPERIFEGEPKDIAALNFIDYEAGSHPDGAVGAAIIFGSVLVKTGLFAWAVAEDGQFALTTTCDYPRVTILPYARLVEIDGSSWPSPSTANRFDWLLEEVIVRLCVGGVDGDQLRPILALLDPHETLYWDAAKAALDVLKSGGLPGTQ